MNETLPKSARVLPKAEVLRQNVMEKLEALTVEQLATLHDLLLQTELESLAREISEDFTAAEAAGKLTPELIEASIQEHRHNHPYGR